MLKNGKMRYLAIALALTMALSFTFLATACGSPAAPADDSAATSTEAEATSSESASSSSAAPADGEVQTKTIGWYADAADSYYQQNHDTLVAAAQEDPTCEWTVEFKVGQSTAEEQLKAVEDFITAGYDAIIVIQNNPNTTGECIEKCKAAGIPYFGAGYDFAQLSNANDSAGSVEYDFVEAGRLAGADALERGVKKLIMLEGVLGQGASSNFSLGFLNAYQDAGKSLGDKPDGTPYTALDIAKDKPGEVGGTPDFEVVQWLSGNWMAEPAQKAVSGAITSLGKDGFDGIYVQNNPMAEGVIAAMQETGLSPQDYWIGSCNGRELSWEWAEDGLITFDLNQPAALEGILLYQQIKAYFNGEEYKKHVRPYFSAFTKDDIKELKDGLIPCSDIDAFMKGRAENKFVTDINDPKFVLIPGYN
jgi:ABC-type sugar transport system substrate-binding protein